MQTLTPERVKAAARAAFRKGQLAAQHPNKEKRQCHYQIGRNYGCAIGKSLTKNTLKAVHEANENGGGLQDLICSDLVKVDRKDIPALESIQKAHDSWCKSAREWGLRDEVTITDRDYFLHKIGMKVPA